MSHQFGKDAIMDGSRGRGENLGLGLLAGLVAAAIGAVIWMQITLATGLRVGFVALLIGALVGIAVRFGGNGAGIVFGLMGGLLTLAGCLGGELLVQIQGEVTLQRDFYSSLVSADLTRLFPIIIGNMSPISYLIYGIGVFEGYQFSMRR